MNALLVIAPISGAFDHQSTPASLETLDQSHFIMRPLPATLEALLATAYSYENTIQSIEAWFNENGFDEDEFDNEPIEMEAEWRMC